MTTKQLLLLLLLYMQCICLTLLCCGDMFVWLSIYVCQCMYWNHWTHHQTRQSMIADFAPNEHFSNATWRVMVNISHTPSLYLYLPHCNTLLHVEHCQVHMKPFVNFGSPLYFWTGEIWYPNLVQKLSITSNCHMALNLLNKVIHEMVLLWQLGL